MFLLPLCWDESDLETGELTDIDPAHVTDPDCLRHRTPGSSDEGRSVR